MTYSWVSKGLSDFSREFYEFTMPAIDMFEGDDINELIVKIDLPGYSKKDTYVDGVITVRIPTVQPKNIQIL
jgi:HSP20 family molecular chaperone IbpA